MAPLSTRWGSFLLASTSWLAIGAAIAVFGSAINNRFYPPICNADRTICDYPNPPPVDPRMVLGVCLLGIGAGIFIAAWKLDRREGERPRGSWANFWTWSPPLVWLALIPMATLPLTVIVLQIAAGPPNCELTPGFFGASADCPVGAIVPVLVLPGLLNLQPLLRLTAADPRARLAGIVGSALGIAQLGIPVLGLLSEGPRIEVDSGFLLPPYPPLPLPILGIGIILWLSSMLAMLVIAKIR